MKAKNINKDGRSINWTVICRGHGTSTSSMYFYLAVHDRKHVTGLILFLIYNHLDLLYLSYKNYAQTFFIYSPILFCLKIIDETRQFVCVVYLRVSYIWMSNTKLTCLKFVYLFVYFVLNWILVEIKFN